MSARPASAGRRPDVEKTLADRGFTWEYHPKLDLELFDVDRSLKNQARLGNPLQPDTVHGYRAALSNGDLFPAIIAAETRSAKGLLIVDGNHRYAAHAEQGRTGIDAYVIKGASMQAITMFTFEANTKHGLPTSETERVRQALWMIDNGMSAEDAARRLALKVHVLRQANALADAGRRADDAGILRSDWDRLPAGTILRLGQISTDEGFAALAALTVQAKLTSTEVGHAATAMAQLRSSRKQTQYVTALRAQYADRLQTGGVNDTSPRGRQPRTPRTQLAMALGQVDALPTPATIATFFTDDDREDFAARIATAMQVLQDLHKVLVS